MSQVSPSSAGEPRQPGAGAADDEQEQRDDIQAPGSPQVGAAAGQRHGDHVCQQVGVDDPAHPREVCPAAEVGDDGREGDRDHHQLGAAEEHAEAGDDQRGPRRDGVHAHR